MTVENLWNNLSCNFDIDPSIYRSKYTGLIGHLVRTYFRNGETLPQGPRNDFPYVILLISRLHISSQEETEG